MTAPKIKFTGPTTNIGSLVAIAKRRLEKLREQLKFRGPIFRSRLDLPNGVIEFLVRESGIDEIRIKALGTPLERIIVRIPSAAAFALGFDAPHLTQLILGGDTPAIPVVGPLSAVSTGASAVLRSQSIAPTPKLSTFQRAGASKNSALIALFATSFTEGGLIRSRSMVVSYSALSLLSKSFLAGPDDLFLSYFAFDTTYGEGEDLRLMFAPFSESSNRPSFIDPLAPSWLVLSFTANAGFWGWPATESVAFTSIEKGASIEFVAPNSDGVIISLPTPDQDPPVPPFFFPIPYFTGGVREINVAGPADGEYFGYAFRIVGGVENEDGTISGTMHYEMRETRTGEDRRVRWASEVPGQYDLRETVHPDDIDLLSTPQHAYLRYTRGVDESAGYYVALNHDVHDTQADIILQTTDVDLTRYTATVTRLAEVANFLDYTPGGGFTLGQELMKSTVTVGPYSELWSWSNPPAGDIRSNQYSNRQSHTRKGAAIMDGEEKTFSVLELSQSVDYSWDHKHGSGPDAETLTVVSSEEYTLGPADPTNLVMVFPTQEGTFYFLLDDPLTLLLDDQTIAEGIAFASTLRTTDIPWEGSGPYFLDRADETIDVDLVPEGLAHVQPDSPDGDGTAGAPGQTYSLVHSIPYDAGSTQPTFGTNILMGSTPGNNQFVLPGGSFNPRLAGATNKPGVNPSPFSTSYPACVPVPSNATFPGLPPVQGISIYCPNIVPGRDGVCIATRTAGFLSAFNAYQADPSVGNQTAMQAEYTILLNNFAPRDLIEHALSYSGSNAFVILPPLPS